MKATPSQAQAQASDKPFGAIKVSYDLEYVLPMDEAIEAFRLLSKAQRINTDLIEILKELKDMIKIWNYIL